MRYTLNIDWLSLYCTIDIPSEGWVPMPGSSRDGALWHYRDEVYGTRQYKRLTYVSIPNEQRGYDDFAEVQSHPYSSVLDSSSVIVRINNRILYKPNFWTMVEQFLQDNAFHFRSISRIDLCADFNNFDCCHPRELIERFAAKKYRHIGRGIGALYFDHGVMAIRDINGKPTGKKEYGVHYTGLAFGSHESNARVYLYNKTFELATQKDKPYIRDTWKTAGLDVREVWRLEVSIKSQGRKFKDKKTGYQIEIGAAAIADGEDELLRIYLAYVRQLFAFVVNRKGITNISREPRLPLFRDGASYERGSIRNVSCSSRLEKMLIKGLYSMGDNYRGIDQDIADKSQAFAMQLAESTDLTEWLERNRDEWSQPTHK